MTRSSPSFIQQNKPPDPPLTSSSLSKSSLNSSSSSLSPSASVLMSSRTPFVNTARTNYRSSKSPVLPSTGSLSSSTRSTKLEQIIQNFYTKTVQIIVQSRVPVDCLKGKSKLNKWFNITTEDSEQIREETRYWKSFIKYQQEGETPPPPLLLEIFSADKRVVLETWTLTLNHPQPDFPVDLPNLYKRSIIFFRSLHSLVRLLPAYNLRNKRKSESILNYRLSSKLSQHSDEISIGQAISDSDRIQAYELTDVVTPLGTFKLKLLYRENCQFDMQNESPLSAIDIEEDFFKPLVHHQEQRKETKQQSTRPVSLPAIMTTHETISLVGTDRPHRGSIQWIKPSTSTERRLSTAFVSPFKSPSLSSSPQAELMFTSRSQTSDKIRLESGSFGRKREFSSSFEKYKSNSPNRISTGDTSGMSMMRRLSRTSDHSSIYLESEEDEDLEDFMRFIGSKQDLKIFQNSDYPSSVIVESHSSLFASDSVYKSKKALSHFRNLQETHNTLSDTMLLNQNNPTSDYYSNTSQHSYSSSSSSNKGLNQPAIPSPLHTIESITTFSKNQSPKDLIPTPPPPPPPLSSFFDYDKDTTHSKHRQEVFIDKKDPMPIVLQNRQPAPSPPLILQQKYSSGQSIVDDDDSLVFKMSELGYEDSGQLEFNTTATEYAKRLQQRGMRRINSSGNVPRLKKRCSGSDEEEKQIKSPNSSGTSSAISSKSDPVSMPPAGTLAHSLFYDS